MKNKLKKIVACVMALATISCISLTPLNTSATAKIIINSDTGEEFGIGVYDEETLGADYYLLNGFDALGNPVILYYMPKIGELIGYDENNEPIYFSSANSIGELVGYDKNYEPVYFSSINSISGNIFFTDDILYAGNLAGCDDNNISIYAPTGFRVVYFYKNGTPLIINTEDIHKDGELIGYEEDGEPIYYSANRPEDDGNIEDTLGDSVETVGGSDTGIRGDVNYDGKVNVSDLIYLRRYLLHLIKW